MLDLDQLKKLRLRFDRVREHSELRADQFRRLRSGELTGRVATAFVVWLIAAIESGEVVAEDPGLLRKAINLGRAVVDHAKDKAKKVPKKVRAERMTICRACPLYNEKRGTCRHPDCGCVMQRKTRWASSFCPIGKWGRFNN